MSGYSADIQSLHDVADNRLPEVANTLSSDTSQMFGMKLTTSTISGSVDGSSSAFGTLVPESAWLGQQYNGILDALAHVGVALSQTVNNAAAQLNTIADNYDTVERNISGD